MNKNIALHGKKIESNSINQLKEILDSFISFQNNYWVSKEFYSDLKENKILPDSFQPLQNEGDLNKIDMFWSIGGDGTFLETVSKIGGRDIPILGINMGRLGFLATLSPNDLTNGIEEIKNGNFTIESRSMIEVESDLEPFWENNFGLNEVGIMKTDTSSMINVKSYLNGEFLNNYWADGLIIATATGSTAYSLSIGGPIILPTSDHFIIAPMSPHNLTVRPIVIPNDAELKFEISSRSNNFLLSLDSHSKVMESTNTITVRKGKYSAKIIKIPGDNFFKTLRNKLHWGLDMRN
ncbi:MAG: kinase [Bacteroidota bacterium]